MRFRLVYILLITILTACGNVSNEKRLSEGKLINGKKEGTWRIYDSTGVLKEIANYKEDSLNGLRITYENGKIYTRAHYKMGLFVDSFFLYFQNGQIQTESWIDSLGQEQGLYKIYYENGRIRQIGHVINDKYVDTIKTYYDNSQLMCLEFYKNGKKEGILTYFDEQGKPIKKEYYKNDSLLNEKFLNSR
jgi:uncharacterized protein